ncbi:hypothetical protein M3Y94_00538700 [Aphelenchoides besseyi]|nr:hypothetical protein M3Y94_00538700 [Aphelenchoides besseyi]
MNSRRLIVCDKKHVERFQLEADEVTLMFLDVLMAQLNAGTSGSSELEYAEYFEYEDEDKEWLTVRTDEELSSMLMSTEPDVPIRICLKSTKPTQQMSTGGFARIAPGQLHRLERLGSGQFGTVYRAIDEHDRDLAVKCIGDTGDQKTNMSLLNEIEILKKCQSPFIVKFYGASFEEGEWLIRLELMDGLSLDRYHKLPPDVLGNVVVAVAHGLKYLWDLKVMHRDVKPSNFLVNTKGDVKLTDFGVSRQMIFSSVFSSVGTNRYLAPERLNCEKYREYSDVWSAGVSFAEMALGHFPIGGTYNEWMQFLTLRQSPVIDLQFCGQLFQEFINKCLQYEPNKRFKPNEILVDPFVLQHTPMDKNVISSFVRHNLPQVYGHLTD